MFLELIESVLIGLLFIFVRAAPKLTEFAYRRHIEREADHLSITALGSHDGALVLFERWQKDFKMLEHNPFELTADHPSIFERKQYCMNYKNNSQKV